MNGWVTPMELQIVAAEILRDKTRERVRLNPTRRFKVRNLAMALLSFLF